MINNSVDNLKFIGKETTSKLSQYLIYSIEDLLFTFPKKYEDYIIDNSDSTMIATIMTTPVTSSFRISKTSFKIKVLNHTYTAVAYRRPYLSSILNKDDEVIIKAKFDQKKKIYLIDKIKPIHIKNQIEPQYQLKDIQDFLIRKALLYLFDQHFKAISHEYNEDVAKKGYLSYFEALKGIHIPTNYDHLNQAYQTMKLFHAIDLMKKIQRKSTKIKRPSLKIIDEDIEYALSFSPFELTNDQKESIKKIVDDMNDNVAFEYLIQGDVGSGKTIVAFILAIIYSLKGYQVAMMAPTEILATQHYDTFRSIFKTSSVLLTGSSKNKKSKIKQIQDQKTSIVFGTHALVSKDVIFNNLGLVVIDEQHKFGVEIRRDLLEKSVTKDLIYLTATPIPRSLMHVIYGTAKVSNIHSSPKGRQKITTKSIHNDTFPLVIDQVKEALKHHQHIFIVVPSIASERSTFNVVSVYHKLKLIFNEQLFVIHGQMKQEEQEASMSLFKQSEGGILLATSMIEVGVNIPTATFMIVLDANFFGLSQLHQLRGRIGRGDLKGICYLLSNDPENERLKQLEQLTNGFEISELDLKVRGPGKLLGTLQSGNYKEGIIDLVEDLPIINEAKEILGI